MSFVMDSHYSKRCNDQDMTFSLFYDKLIMCTPNEGNVNFFLLQDNIVVPCSENREIVEK